MRRYALFQIPDMTILVLILILINLWIAIPSWLFWGFISMWVVKDILVFLFVWRAYDRPAPGDPRDLIGTEGIAEERLAPSGYVRVHGEIWRAEVKGGVSVIEKGERVSIQGMSGLTLHVEPIRKND